MGEFIELIKSATNFLHALRQAVSHGRRNRRFVMTVDKALSSRSVISPSTAVTKFRRFDDGGLRIASVRTYLAPIGCALSRAGLKVGAVRGSAWDNGAEVPASGASIHLLTYLLYSAYFTKTTSYLK